MQVVLVTANECDACHIREQQLGKYIQSGEITVVNLEDDPEKVTELVNLGLGIPSLAVITDDGAVLMEM